MQNILWSEMLMGCKKKKGWNDWRAKVW